MDAMKMYEYCMLMHDACAPAPVGAPSHDHMMHGCMMMLLKAPFVRFLYAVVALYYAMF